MATIRGFKGVRPDASFAAKVAALPYDVLNSDEARESVKNNPNSFLFVDKAEISLDKSIDLYDDKVYQQAKYNLDKMVEDKILIQDDFPSMYIYMLTMNGKSQTGIVACTSIDEYIDGTIKKHELTREDKEKDRIRHVDICNANTGPIFLAYRQKAEVDAIVLAWKNSNAPIYDFVADDGIGHKVWIISDLEVLNSLSEEFKLVTNLYIADGHHRNASAVKVGLKRRETAGSYDGSEEFNYYLSVVFPDNQLYIMDYNRVVKDLCGMSDSGFIEKIKESFIVKESKTNGKPETYNSFGMYLNGKWYDLKAKDSIIYSFSGNKEKNAIVDALDVSILQKYLLEPILNIGDIRTDKRIDFVGGIRGLKELEISVDSGEMKVAFSMFPTSMDELLNVADSGLIMPPKSTWFEPKLRSGLFVHYLD